MRSWDIFPSFLRELILEVIHWTRLAPYTAQHQLQENNLKPEGISVCCFVLDYSISLQASEPNDIKNEKVHRHLLPPQQTLSMGSLGTAGSGASSPADGPRPTGTQSFTQSEGLAGIIMEATVFINNCSLSVSSFVPVSSSKNGGN